MALRELSAGRKLLVDVESSDAAAVRARLASFAVVVQYAQEHSREALRRADEAIVLARAAGEHEALAEALMLADMADLSESGVGDFSRTREALAIFEAMGNLWREGQARANLGFLTATAGRWDEAERWFTSARAVCQRSGDAVLSALQELNLGETLVNQRRASEALPMLDDAVRVLRAVGFADGAAYGDLQRARAWFDLGRLDDAAEMAFRVAREFDTLGQAASSLEASLVAADALAARVTRGRRLRSSGGR